MEGYWKCTFDLHNAKPALYRLSYGRSSNPLPKCIGKNIWTGWENVIETDWSNQQRSVYFLDFKAIYFLWLLTRRNESHFTNGIHMLIFLMFPELTFSSLGLSSFLNWNTVSIYFTFVHHFLLLCSFEFTKFGITRLLRICILHILYKRVSTWFIFYDSK